MLYEIAHIIRDKFGFLWDAIEWGNAEAFALMHHRTMKGLPGLLEGDEIVGYFFMCSFVNGKTFKGYIVGIDHRGMGVAGEMGIAMNRIAEELGLRMFKSISPENPVIELELVDWPLGLHVEPSVMAA